VLPGAVVYCRDALDAAQGADLLLILTEWNEFRAIDPVRLRETMRGDLVMDLRNLYEPAAMRAAGFRYQCIGRP
jgi:UDPglucose 6-dehydrogenase